MAETQHTPGPWRASPAGFIQAPRRSTREMHDIDVARVFDSMRGTGLYAGEPEANARLIAAAPALLDALRSIERDARAWSENLARIHPRASIEIGRIAEAARAVIGDHE